MKQYMGLSIIVSLWILYSCTNTLNHQDDCYMRSFYDITIKADTLWEDVDLPLLHNVCVLSENKVICVDSTEFYTFSEPKLVFYNDTICYLFLESFDPSTLCRYCVFRCASKHCLKLDTLVAICFIGDIDGDKIIEVVGEDWSECVSSNYDSCTYDPIMVYKCGADFIFDSVTSNKLTVKKYGFVLDNYDYRTRVKCGKRISYADIPIYIQGKEIKNGTIEIHKIID